MVRIPAAALLLGLAGLVPFLWGALVVLGFFDPGAIDASRGFFGWIVVRDGPLLMVRYGVIVLCFTSGIFWGYSSNATGMRSTMCYLLSIIPAVWIFLNPGSGPSSALINLMIGFAAVLMLDTAFWRWQLAPQWWMAFRMPLSLITLACLGIGVWG